MAAQASISALQLGLPAVAPWIRAELGLTLAATGALLGASTLGVIATLLAWGALADRVGERAVIAAGLAGAAGALVLASRAGSAAQLGAALALAGALGSSANAASGRAVVAWFAPSRRGTALGLRHMATPAGGAVAAALLPLAAARGGLEAALLALAAACLAGALAALAGLRRAPERPAAALDEPPPAVGPLRDARIWRLSLATACVVLAQIAVLSFLALYLYEERGWGAGAAALALAGVQAAGAGARVAAGVWSDRRRRRVGPLRALALAAAVALAAAAALLPAPDALAVPALLLAGTLAMAGNGVSFAAAAEMAGGGRVGTALGLQNTVLFLAVAAAPPLFGGVVGLLSWPAAFALAAACPLAGWWALRPLAAAEAARASRRAPAAGGGPGRAPASSGGR